MGLTVPCHDAIIVKYRTTARHNKQVKSIGNTGIRRLSNLEKKLEKMFKIMLDRK